MINYINIDHLPDKPRPNTVYLRNDSWDDYGFKTTFEVHFIDNTGLHHELGHAKIVVSNMKKGRTQLPTIFSELSNEYCSLGQSQDYYERIYELNDSDRLEILNGLKDCVANPSIWDSFQGQKSVEDSLLRSVDIFSITNTYRNILKGISAPTSYDFKFKTSEIGIPSSTLEINFSVKPVSMPPSNVHVIIGRNGVGKTRLLTSLSKSLTSKNYHSDDGMVGDVELTTHSFYNGPYRSGKFANLVAIAFSAFDRFPVITEDQITGDILYSYVGLRKPSADKSTEGGLKSHAEINSEFAHSLSQSLRGPRHKRWIDVVKTLNSDPGFAELELHELDAINNDQLGIAVARFDQLSSGHRIVLLIAAKLVELVDERTLVLIDEPESHLHPPLLSSLMRALSNLLMQRNGVAVVATHSPVVLQEVPQGCVTILRRTGNIISAHRPSIQTFAENVGVLTREVFQLEVTESGYHNILREASLNSTYESAVTKFDGQIGSEGKAIIRALTAKN
jgi:ABC-type cobalamin/Fe3+-siderophores transport system ATPase subunit